MEIIVPRVGALIGQKLDSGLGNIMQFFVRRDGSGEKIIIRAMDGFAQLDIGSNHGALVLPHMSHNLAPKNLGNVETVLGEFFRSLEIFRVVRGIGNNRKHGNLLGIGRRVHDVIISCRLRCA